MELNFQLKRIFEQNSVKGEFGVLEEVIDEITKTRSTSSEEVVESDSEEITNLIMEMNVVDQKNEMVKEENILNKGYDVSMDTKENKLQNWYDFGVFEKVIDEITKTSSASSEEVVEGDSAEIIKTIPVSSEKPTSSPVQDYKPM